MSPEQDQKNASYIYSLNLLRLLVRMELISVLEYERIKQISASYYGTEKVKI